MASPYTALTERNKDAEGPTLVLPLPANRAKAGPWLLAEAKQALADLRAQYPKAKDFERNCHIGLSLKSGEAHVVPFDDPEADVRLNPKFLIDGLGSWPSDICWSPSAPTVTVRVNPNGAGETRYWIALIVRPDPFSKW